MKFGREPSLVIAFIGTLLSLLAGFGLDFLTTEQAGLITAVLTAALGVWNALKVRPVAPAAFTYAAGLVFTLLATYGLDFSQEQIGAFNALILTGLALLLRGNVSPTETAPPAALRR